MVYCNIVYGIWCIIVEYLRTLQAIVSGIPLLQGPSEPEAGILMFMCPLGPRVCWSSLIDALYSKIRLKRHSTRHIRVTIAASSLLCMQTPRIRQQHE